MLTNNTEFAGQQEKILEVFKARGYGHWIGRIEFPPTILDFTTRIWELRWKRDFNIQSERLPNKNGKAIWRYRLLPGSWRDLRGKPEPGYAKREAPISSFSAGKPLKSWDEVVREREEKMRQPAPEFELTP